MGNDFADLHKMAPEAGDDTPFLVIQAISGSKREEYLTLDQHLTARAKRRGKSAQACLLTWMFTKLPIFPRSRVMRGRSTCGFGNTPRDLRDVCTPHTVLVVIAPARS